VDRGEACAALLVGDQHASAGVAQRISKVLADQPRIERHPDQPGPGAAEPGVELFRRVEHEGGDPVALHQAAHQQVGRDDLRDEIELAVRDGRACDLGEGGVAVAGVLVGEQVAEGSPGHGVAEDLQRSVVHRSTLRS